MRSNLSIPQRTLRRRARNQEKEAEADVNKMQFDYRNARWERQIMQP